MQAFVICHVETHFNILNIILTTIIFLIIFEYLALVSLFSKISLNVW